MGLCLTEPTEPTVPLVVAQGRGGRNGGTEGVEGAGNSVTLVGRGGGLNDGGGSLKDSVESMLRGVSSSDLVWNGIGLSNVGTLDLARGATGGLGGWNEGGGGASPSKANESVLDVDPMDS